jgi:hypothetical protein
MLLLVFDLLSVFHPWESKFRTIFLSTYSQTLSAVAATQHGSAGILNQTFSRSDIPKRTAHFRTQPKHFRGLT